MKLRIPAKLRFLFSPDEELGNGSTKIWETFINVFVVLKFLSDQVYFLTTYIMNTDRTTVSDYMIIFKDFCFDNT